MSNILTSTSSILIHAPAERVWDALTDPAQIKQYLFGTDAKSDWKEGSPITYTGEWEGKKYEDKGTIIDIIPNKKLHTTYWSSMSGKENKPENYNNVLYELNPEADSTLLTIVQDNIPDDAGVQHMNENWGKVLEGIKRVVEE
jgi:uncharacterized protein YndB with AHSA1/START domain